MSANARKTIAAFVTIAFFCAVIALTFAAFATQEAPIGTAVATEPPRDDHHLSDQAWTAITTMVASIVATIAALIIALKTNKLPPAATTGDTQARLTAEIERLNRILDDHEKPGEDGQAGSI